MNMDVSESGCCPKFDPTQWDKQEVNFDNKLFVKGKTRSFLHIPLNMGKMYKELFGAIKSSNAELDDGYLILSHDPSAWRGEHLIAVKSDVSGCEMVRLSGTFLTKVYEGSFKEMRTWMKDLEEYIQSQNKNLKKMYFFYTTCPKCAKHWGKNYVVGFAEVE